MADTTGTNRNIRKVLLIKTSSLGDIIHFLPCLRPIHDLYPDAKISMLIQKEYAGLLRNNADIDRFFFYEPLSAGNMSSLQNAVKLIKSLRREQFDVVIDYQWLMRTSMIAFLSGAPERIGLQNWKEPSHLFYTRKVYVNHEHIHAVERNIHLAEALGARIEKVEFPLTIDSSAQASVHNLLGDTVDYILLIPASRWKTKNWPEQHFASLINKLNMTCVLTGGKGDRAIIDRIKAASTSAIDLCGKTDLQQLTALIAGAKAVVSSDSGPMHIAAALDVPLVALFGPTNPVKTGPYGWQTGNNMKVITSNAPCQPCFKRECSNPFCMKDISVDTVYDALKDLL
jgi:lipopolysaccharide heptosyltransferase I